jgi:hypothetical protein
VGPRPLCKTPLFSISSRVLHWVHVRFFLNITNSQYLSQYSRTAVSGCNVHRALPTPLSLSDALRSRGPRRCGSVWGGTRSRALADCEAMSGSTHLTGLADGRGRGGTRDGVGALAYVHPSASTVVRSRPRRTAIRYIYAFSGCLPRREAGHTRWDLGSPGSGHNLGRFPVADGREFVEVHVALLLTRLLIHLALRSLAPREMFEALRDLRKGRKALAI